MSKPPIFHPFSTNTGQIFLTELLLYPRNSLRFEFTGGAGGIPVAPVQIETELDEVVLHVRSETDILVGLDDTTIPTLGTPDTIKTDEIFLFADQIYILQWPSQYFTPIPLDTIAALTRIFVSTINPQNSAGDPYKLENR